MSEPTLSRREITRQRTLEEIRSHAEEQVRVGGAEAISLNAIAKSMGMSGPAIYRYYASRNDLITDLITKGYAELTIAMGEAIGAAGDDGPEGQLRAVSRAYRAWALANPHRFSMFYSVRTEESVYLEEAIDSAQGSMDVLFVLLDQIEKKSRGGKAKANAIDDELESWRSIRGIPDSFSLKVLKLGLLSWTRLHGIVTLELAGVFTDMEMDAGVLCDSEVDTIIAAAKA